MTAIRLGLLGGFEVQGEDGEPLSIGMRKAKALLAWLAMHPGRPQLRDRLAGLLWPESSEAQARHSLRQALSVLRRALPDTGAALLTEGEGVALVAGAVTTDVDELQRLADSGRTADLEHAAALYRGEFLEGTSAPASAYEDWMLQERSLLRERITQVLERLLAHYRDRGDWEPALRAVSRLVALDPLREAIHRELMGLYVRSGRPAEALRQYRNCKALVQRELGVAPEAATVELYRRILGNRSRSAPEALGPALAPSMEDSDLSPGKVSHPDLIGRDTELRQLTAALYACLGAGLGGTLLVRGEAGIGKTTLTGVLARLADAKGFLVHRIRLLDAGSEAADASAALLIRDLLGLDGDATEERVRDMVSAVCTDPDASLFLLDALGVALDVGEERFYRALDIPSRASGMRAAVGRLLQAASRARPRLLLVEDIHWAGAGLLGLLAGLAADAAEAPALLVLTTRAGGEPLDPAWRGATRGAPLLTLDLGPLRPDAARELAGRLGTADSDWTSHCLARAEGNPLFLKHLLDAGPEAGDKVPASVQELVEC